MDIYKLGKVIDALKEYVDEKIHQELEYHEDYYHQIEARMHRAKPDWKKVEQAIYDAL